MASGIIFKELRIMSVSITTNAQGAASLPLSYANGIPVMCNLHTSGYSGYPAYMFGRWNQAATGNWGIRVYALNTGEPITNTAFEGELLYYALK